MYVCLYIYIYIYLFIYIYSCAYIYIYAYTYIFVSRGIWALRVCLNQVPGLGVPGCPLAATSCREAQTPWMEV